MAETGESVLGRMKEFLSDRFWFVEKYHKFIDGHHKPLSWSDSDVDAFIACDPVHGPAVFVLALYIFHEIELVQTCRRVWLPTCCGCVALMLVGWCTGHCCMGVVKSEYSGVQLKSAREVTKFAAAGSALGAVNLAGIAWKYSKSPHGTALSLAAGAALGWTFGQETGNHYHQLYRIDTMGAQVKFLEWLESKKGASS